MKASTKQTKLNIVMAFILFLTAFWPILIGFAPVRFVLSFFTSIYSLLYAIFSIITFGIVFYFWWNAPKERRILYYLILFLISAFFLYGCFCGTLRFGPEPPISLSTILIAALIWFYLLTVLILDRIDLKRKQ